MTSDTHTFYATLQERIEKEWLPAALAVGVPYDNFWFMNPRRIQSYVSAYEINRKTRAEEANMKAWLIGIYVAHAVGSLVSRQNKYPEQPIDMFGEGMSPEDRQAQEAELFRAYVAEINKQFE